MLTKIYFFVILFTLVSCGDSPFLNKKSEGESLSISSLQSLSSALSLKGDTYNIQFYWRVGPVVYDESKLLIVVTDKNGVPTEIVGSLALMIWMPTMGHGSYPIAVAKVGVGLYEATDIYFTMGGYWDIHFQLLENGKISDQVTSGLTL